MRISTAAALGCLVAAVDASAETVDMLGEHLGVQAAMMSSE